MIQLIGGVGQEGYSHALLRAFTEGRRGIKNIPVKSALAKMRRRIKYTFFEEIFSELIRDFDSRRSKFKGLFIYAVDGLQLTMPRTADIVKAGYTGRAVSKYRDTYMPRMYLTHA